MRYDIKNKDPLGESLAGLRVDVEPLKDFTILTRDLVQAVNMGHEVILNAEDVMFVRACLRESLDNLSFVQAGVPAVSSLTGSVSDSSSQDDG